MINAIAFSKDRACQLHLLISSLEKNAKNIFELKIIYTYSNEEFEKGYEKLIEMYPEIKWFKQSDNFKQDVLTNLETEHKYSCFFTDDDILYRPIKEEEMTSKLEENNDAFCFSGRLGLNTTKCYTMNCDNVLKPEYEDDKFIKWDWKVHFMDSGYPLSLDFHVFRTNEITKLTKKVSFTNPNTFEEGLQMFDGFPKTKMWAYKHSSLVGVPVNIVNDTHPNLNGQNHSISTESLNDKFLNGEIIDYDNLDFENITGCHQEIKYKFKECNK